MFEKARYVYPNGNTFIQAAHTFIQDTYTASRYTVKNELTDVKTKHFDD